MAERQTPNRFSLAPGILPAVVLMGALAVNGVGMAAPAGESVCPDPLVQGWEPWPPYQIPRDGAPTGIDIAIVKAIAAEMDCELGYRQMPWTRLLDSIAAGDVDFAVQANYTQRRAAFAYYSDPYLPYETRLIVEAGARQDYPDLQSFLDAGKTVGVVRGYDYGSEVDRLLRRKPYRDQVVEAYTVGAHVKPLAIARVDGVIAEPAVFAHAAQQAGLRDEIAVTDLVVTQVRTYAIFSKASTSRATVRAFNKAMAEVRNRGRFQRIIERYLQDH